MRFLSHWQPGALLEMSAVVSRVRFRVEQLDALGLWGSPLRDGTPADYTTVMGAVRGADALRACGFKVRVRPHVLPAAVPVLRSVLAGF